MKIAIVSSPLIKTPPDNYGGIERITYWLGRRLVEFGHEVHLFGRTGSYLEGGMVHEFEGGENSEYADFIAKLYLEHGFDVIHDCTHDKKLVERYPQFSSRTIASLQGMANRGPNTTCISQAQRRDLGYSDSVPVIYHGIPVDEYPFNPEPTKDYFLYMGSINDYKGVDIAVDVCNRTGERLIVAGVAWDQAYFKAFVEPRCDGSRIIWAGEVGGQRKLDLLSNARALLHPVRWTEPGAIIVGEALACGVPVIGSNNGVIPELIHPAVGKICEVQHFDRGYIHMMGGCYNAEQWDYAIRTIDEIDREDCAVYAREILTDTRMTLEYLECYQKIIEGKTW